MIEACDNLLARRGAISDTTDMRAIRPVPANAALAHPVPPRLPIPTVLVTGLALAINLSSGMSSGQTTTNKKADDKTKESPTMLEGKSL
jgi:hypothetical protein